MPVGGRAERLGFLRAEIDRIEAQTVGKSPGPRTRPGALRHTAFGTSLASLLNGGLARCALHEILAARPGDLAAAAGFVLALAIRFAHDRMNDHQAPIIWISEDFAALENGGLYGPGLAFHGLDPKALVLVQAPNAKEALWSFEEALKCRAPAVVVSEIWSLAKTYDLTASRRLVLAAQKSGTPGLLFAPGLTGATDRMSSGAETRFEIRARPSPQLAEAGGRPLPGLAAWSVRIAKARASPIGIDRALFRPILWDHAEASFHDALPLSLAPLSRNGSDRPAIGQTLEHARIRRQA
jgi:protein ImuA